MGVYLLYTSYDYTKMQGPAPSGFHVPLSSEWDAVKTVWTDLGGGSSDGTNFRIALKLPFSGLRLYSSGNVNAQNANGRYWTCSGVSTSNAYYMMVSQSSIQTGNSEKRSYGYVIRPFKNVPVVPDSSWTKLYGTSIEAGGIFWSSTDGLISLSSNGTTWITIADKNLGATTVWNSGDTLRESNCGKYYQWGNNYGFPRTGTVTTSSTQVDASNYGPGNYYSSSTFIKRSSSPYDWSSVQNDNLWGGITGVSPMSELKNAYIGEVGEYTISNIPTTDTNVYVNVARSGKTIQSVTFKFIVNRVSRGGAYIQMSSNNSNTMRYGPVLEMEAGTGLRIRGRTSGSDTYFRTITTGYNSGGTNNVEFTINRDGTGKVVCNGGITNYTATGSELTIIQTIMNLSNMNVYAAQNASGILTDNKVDVEVTYS